MRYYEILLEAPVAVISPQQAIDGKMFGPVYHGTHGDIDAILATGFNNKYTVPTSGVSTLTGRPISTSNGYAFSEYANGIAAPVHHLGYGTYLSTVKAIAKNFNGGTTKGLKTFYIDTRNILEINFGAPNTMMKWWQKNGYDMTAEATRKRDMKAWIKATGNLTRTLRQQCDAVYYKGKGIRKLLDGDQICVFNPTLIRIVDPKLASGLDVGSKVVHTGVNQYQGSNQLYVDAMNDGWKGIFRTVDHQGNDMPREGAYPLHMIPPPTMTGIIVGKRDIPEQFRAMRGDCRYDVKWAKGGVKYNYTANELRPVTK